MKCTIKKGKTSKKKKKRKKKGYTEDSNVPRQRSPQQRGSNITESQASNNENPGPELQMNDNESLGSAYLVRYLEDVNALFKSEFEMRDKSNAGYCADLILKELLVVFLEFSGTVYLFVKGGLSKIIFGFEIGVFTFYLIGNTALIFEKYWLSKPA